MTSRVVVALRLAFLAALSVLILPGSSPPSVGALLNYSLLLPPLFMIPLRGGVVSTEVLWATLIALPQVLHIYPVAGSQVGWGIFLLVPIAVVGLYDTWPLASSVKTGAQAWLRRTGSGLIFAAGLAQVVMLLHTGWFWRTTALPLDLPGTESLRLDGRARLLLRITTLNATLHSDVLFSSPGMFSYNIWSGIAPPTSQNATHWFWLLDTTAQEKIIARLAGLSRSAVIVDHRNHAFLRSIHVPAEGPLQNFINRRYKVLFSLNEQSFLVPAESRAAPFGMVEIFTSESAPKDRVILLKSNVVLNGQPASVQLQDMEIRTPTRRFSSTGGRIVLQPVTSTGAPAGAPVALDAAGEVHGLFELLIYTDQPPSADLKYNSALVILDASGAILSESVF